MGQRAMARVLLGLKVETVLVIAHGLRCDSLYGAFDEVDTVVKAEDASRVVQGDCELHAVG